MFVYLLCLQLTMFSLVMWRPMESLEEESLNNYNMCAKSFLSLSEEP